MTTSRRAVMVIHLQHRESLSLSVACRKRKLPVCDEFQMVAFFDDIYFLGRSINRRNDQYLAVIWLLLRVDDRLHDPRAGEVKDLQIVPRLRLHRVPHVPH